MRFEEVLEAAEEMYTNVNVESLRRWFAGVDFVCSDDPYEVAEEAASSIPFGEFNLAD